MQTYPKKRIEIIIESLSVRQITQCLDSASVTGYSVVPVLAGRGQHGSWSLEGQISDAERMLMVVCITDAGRVDEVIDAVFSVITRQRGIVSIADVSVVRVERF